MARLLEKTGNSRSMLTWQRILVVRNITLRSLIVVIAFSAIRVRFVFDGETVRTACFSPRVRSTGAQGLVSRPVILGDGLSRPDTVNFFWDITKLARQVWNPETLLQGTGPPEFEIKVNSEGDIIGTYLLIGAARDRVRFECPRRFGYNIGGLQVFKSDAVRPVQECRLEWKESPGGLWHVRSLDEAFVFSEDGHSAGRVRRVLKYSTFEPNAKVDASKFTEESLELPDGSSIVDNRNGFKSFIYRRK